MNLGMTDEPPEEEGQRQGTNGIGIPLSSMWQAIIFRPRNEGKDICYRDIKVWCWKRWILELTEDVIPGMYWCRVVLHFTCYKLIKYYR